jgi:hypothetical protein
LGGYGARREPHGAGVARGRIRRLTLCRRRRADTDFRLWWLRGSLLAVNVTGEELLVLIAVLVVVLLALAGGAGLLFWIRRAGSCGRTIDVPAGKLVALFYGGVMCRYLITSGSLARLEFYDWGVRLRGNVLSRWIVPTWEARYEEIAIAELVSLHWSRVAVWLKLRGQADGIAFLANGSADILRLLEQHDLPVNRSVTEIRRVEELYRLPE